MTISQPNFVETAKSPEFTAALAAVIDHPLRYHDFLGMPMPRGYSHEEVWQVLAIIQKRMGRKNGMRPWFKGLQKDEVWYYTPKSTIRDLNSIAAIASEESHLNLFVTKRGMHDRDFVDDVIEELSSLAYRDGLSITGRSIRAIWLQEQKPASDAERIIANLRDAFYHMPDFMQGNFFSRVIITEAHRMLIAGVGEPELMPRPYFNPQLNDIARLHDPKYISESLDGVIANSRKAQAPSNIIIQAVENAMMLWDLPYVPSLRCLTEFLVRRAYFLFHRLPAFSYIAFSTAVEQVGREGLAQHEEEYLADSSEGLNVTWLYAAGVKAYAKGAQMLSKLVEHIEATQDGLQKRIQSMANLNARQKSFALAALQMPDKAFKMQDYIRMHDVAYATARSDLMGLVNQGFFTMSKQEKAFVFTLAKP